MFLLVCIITLLGSTIVSTQEVVNTYTEIVDNNIDKAVQILQNVNDEKNETDNIGERSDLSLRTYASLPFHHVVSRREQSDEGSALKRRGFWSTVGKIATGVAVGALLGRDAEEKTYNDQSLRSYLSSPMHRRETSFELRHAKRGFWSTVGKIATGVVVGAVLVGRDIESPSEPISNKQADDLTVTLPDAKLFHQKLGDVTEAVDYLENVLQLEKENFANKDKN